MEQQTDTMTVEWAPFDVLEGVSDAQLIEAANTIEQDFLSQQKGYIRRELLKGEQGKWVDLVYWSSPDLAHQAMEKASQSEACMQYFSLMAGVENAESGVAHYTRVSSWR